VSLSTDEGRRALARKTGKTIYFTRRSGGSKKEERFKVSPRGKITKVGESTRRFVKGSPAEKRNQSRIEQARRQQDPRKAVITRDKSGKVLSASARVLEEEPDIVGKRLSTFQSQMLTAGISGKIGSPEAKNIQSARDFKAKTSFEKMREIEDKINRGERVTAQDVAIARTGDPRPDNIPLDTQTGMLAESVAAAERRRAQERMIAEQFDKQDDLYALGQSRREPDEKNKNRSVFSGGDGRDVSIWADPRIIDPSGSGVRGVQAVSQSGSKPAPKVISASPKKDWLQRWQDSIGLQDTEAQRLKEEGKVFRGGILSVAAGAQDAFASGAEFFTPTKGYLQTDVTKKPDLSVLAVPFKHPRQTLAAVDASVQASLKSAETNPQRVVGSVAFDLATGKVFSFVDDASRASRAAKASSVFKNELVVGDNARDLARISKELSADVRARPIENFRGKTVSTTSPRGTTQDTLVEFNLGKLESIDPKQADQFRDVVLSGQQRTDVLIGSRGNIKSSSSLPSVNRDLTFQSGAMQSSQGSFQKRMPKEWLDNLMSQPRIIEADEINKVYSVTQSQRSADQVFIGTKRISPGGDVQAKAIQEFAGNVNLATADDAARAARAGARPKGSQAKQNPRALEQLGPLRLSDNVPGVRIEGVGRARRQSTFPAIEKGGEINRRTDELLYVFDRFDTKPRPIKKAGFFERIISSASRPIVTGAYAMDYETGVTQEWPKSTDTTPTAPIITVTQTPEKTTKTDSGDKLGEVATPPQFTEVANSGGTVSLVQVQTKTGQAQETKTITKTKKKRKTRGVQTIQELYQPKQATRVDFEYQYDFPANVQDARSLQRVQTRGRTRTKQKMRVDTVQTQRQSGVQKAQQFFDNQLKPAQKQRRGVLAIQGQGQRVGVTTLQDLRRIQRQLPRQEQRRMQRQDQFLGQMFLQRQAQAQRSRQTTQLDTIQRLWNRQSPRSTRVQRSPRPKPRAWPRLDPKSKPKRRQSGEGFFAYVKRRGQWVRVTSRPLLEESARSAGARFAASSAAASFKVVSAGRTVRNQKVDPYFRQNRMKFRQGKKGGFVEKNMFRINSPGELNQITNVGIASSRKASRSRKNPLKSFASFGSRKTSRKKRKR
jgi:hypothetical protein